MINRIFPGLILSIMFILSKAFLLPFPTIIWLGTRLAQKDSVEGWLVRPDYRSTVGPRTVHDSWIDLPILAAEKRVK